MCKKFDPNTFHILTSKGVCKPFYLIESAYITTSYDSYFDHTLPTIENFIFFQ